MRVSEIRVKRIRVNQGLGVISSWTVNLKSTSNPSEVGAVPMIQAALPR